MPLVTINLSITINGAETQEIKVQDYTDYIIPGLHIPSLHGGENLNTPTAVKRESANQRRKDAEERRLFIQRLRAKSFDMFGCFGADAISNHLGAEELSLFRQSQNQYL